MISLLLLELLSVTALLYSILLIFIEFASFGAVAILFVWTIGAGLLYHYLGKRANIFRLSGLLLFLPLYFLRGGIAVAFVIITGASLLFYLERFFHRGSHDDFVDNFRKMAAVYPLAFFLRWSLPDMGNAINRAAPFIFIYFLASIMLIRSIRHVEAGMDLRRLQSTNAGYLVFITSLLVVMSLQEVRQLVSLAAKQVLELLLLPLRLLLWVLGWLMAMLSGLFTGIPSGWEFPEMPDMGTGDRLEYASEAARWPFLAVLLTVLKFVLLALLIAGAAFFLYKLLARAGQASYKGLDYVEEREYLKIEGPKRRRFRGREKLPSQPGEQIRYYYRRFLERLVAREVDLIEADTSLDIQKKAEAVFPDGPKAIRGIYIDSRYGEKEADSATAKQMGQLCNGLESPCSAEKV